jgi:hypothetical protein
MLTLLALTALIQPASSDISDPLSHAKIIFTKRGNSDGGYLQSEPICRCIKFDPSYLWVRCDAERMVVHEDVDFIYEHFYCLFDYELRADGTFTLKFEECPIL